MNNIQQLQNSDRFINYLCAQRFAYTKAKHIFQARIALSLFFAILGPILITNVETIKTYVAILAIFYAIFGFIVLRRLEGNYRREGAKIQELFDVGLLKLNWNSIAVGEKPDTEVVFSYSQKYKAKHEISNLQNWYPTEINQLDLHQATTVCQRTNIWWDVSLRVKLYRSLMIGVIILALVVFLMFSNNASILFPILASLLPLYETLGEYMRAQTRSITRIKILKERLEACIEQLVAGNSISTSDLRAIQDQIYSHRSICPLIPDWFYLLSRSEQEQQMNYSAKHYVDQINNNIS